MAKKLTKEITDTGMTFAFADGTVLGIDYSELSEEMKFRLMQHGLSQKGGDASAGTETVAEAIAETKRVLDRLRNNDWKSVRESAAGAPRVGLLVEALARMTGRDAGECRDAVDALDDDKRKALRAHPQIKAAMADIRAERERAKAAESAMTDLGSLFA